VLSDDVSLGMTPLFKTHFSIGKSILSIDRIFELAKDEEQVVVVEDSFAGFRKTVKKAKEQGKKLIFGLRIDCSHEDNASSKIVLFAKNDSGLKELRKLFSEAYVKNDGILNFESIQSCDVLVAIPFYDSFLHKRIHNFGNSNLPIEKLKECVVFEEENGHPFDYQIQREIDKLKKLNLYSVKFQAAKTILYEKELDFPAFQAYKSMCGRGTGGRPRKFDAPEIEDCNTKRFCWEDYGKK
jgi:hypothetical protein